MERLVKMTIKYAVLNPSIGEYEYVENESDVSAKVAEIALAFYMEHTHNAPVSKVEIDETGAEIWYSASGEIIDRSAIVNNITGTVVNGI